jgi:hypothetical protein
MKNAKSKFFIAICAPAMMLTTSCLEDSDSNTSSLYCVFPNTEMCILGPFSEAECASGKPMNDCPSEFSIYGTTASSSNSAENRATLTIKWNDGNNSIQLKAPDGSLKTPPTAHWAAGWYTGYWSYWVSDNASGELEYSSLGASSRKLVNNSRDLWSFEELP